MSAEKMFSDFFDTTEAEAEIEKLKSQPVKRVRKSKKPATVTQRRKSSSDDDDSDPEQDISGLFFEAFECCNEYTSCSFTLFFLISWSNR